MFSGFLEHLTKKKQLRAAAENDTMRAVTVNQSGEVAAK